AVEAYREKTGALPPGLSALVREGLLKSLPAEPNGGTYLLSPEGKVRSSKMSHRLKVFRLR
ncbi:MAG: pilus assembly protein PilG, partial [Thermodesulfobacteriota bacterium]|nr:pilus assembly protein PilG [Thermodesulfobacteriota bacterium]